jgi:tetratricopeptide (TPR) repeat protein
MAIDLPNVASTSTTAARPASSRPDRPAVIYAWRINMRLLVWSLLVAGALAPALYFWHQFQVRRHVAAVLDRARLLYQKEEWRSAAATFHQYLQFRPDDPEALLLQAQAFDKLSVSPGQKARRISLYFQAVEANPLRTDARLRLAELLFESRRFDEVAVQAGQIDSPPDEALAARRLVASAMREQLGPGKRVTVVQVIDAFEAALAKHKGDIALSSGLAEVLRKHRDVLSVSRHATANEDADRLMDTMVKDHPGDAAALLARYQYRRTFRVAAARRDFAAAERHKKGAAKELLDEEVGMALRDLQAARQVAPDQVEVLLASMTFAAEAAAEIESKSATHDEGAAESMAARDALRDEAEGYGKRLCEVAPQDSRAYLALARLYSQWDRPRDAVAALQAGLRETGDSEIDLNRNLLQLYLFIGSVRQAAGDADETRDFADKARLTLGRLEPSFRRVGAYLSAPVRSRLAEDLAVARAHLELLDGKTLEAIPALKRMAAGVTEGSDPVETLTERERRWRLLAAAYARAGLHDLAGTAFDELIHLQPRSQEYQLRAADEWRLSGDIERAIRRYESLSAGTMEVPEATLALAEARLDLQLRKTAAESRDWQGVDAVLKKARQRQGGTPQVVLVEVTAAIARNDRQAALDALKKLVADANLDVALLPRVAVLFDEAGGHDEADAALDRHRRGEGDPAAAAFAKSEILRRRGDAAGAVHVLEQALVDVRRAGSGKRETTESQIARRLVALDVGAGSMRSARQRLRELRKRRSADLWIYEVAADLAVMAGDDAELKECEDALRELEGPAGSLWRYVQAVRILESGSDSIEAARQANRLLEEIQSSRPAWPQTFVLRGRIEQRLGRIQQAAESYELALRAGARNLTTFQWLMATLYKDGRYTDAASYIRQVGQVAAFSGSASSQAAPANLRAGRLESALRVARAAAELRPADALAQVWFGQTLALSGQAAEAEEVLQNSVRLAPKDIRTRSALVWFYARERRTDEARQTLDELTATIEMTPLERLLVLARGYDLVGDREQAERQYRQALVARKNDARLLEEVGQFYFRFDHNRALDMFQQALALDRKSPQARRGVALLTGLHGNDADWSRAIALLEEADASEKNATVDSRLEATLLIMRGGAENAQRAVDVLGRMIDAQEATVPGDRLLLARACEELEKLDDARRQFEVALGENDAPEFLIAYVEFLNRHDLRQDADRALARLEERDPANLRALELRTDWMNRSGRGSEIEAHVDRALRPRFEAAREPAQKAALLRFAADLLTRTRLFDGAEKRLREAAALVPSGYEKLAIWLARHGRLDEAIPVCLERSSKDGAIRDAAVLIRLLTVAAGSSETTAAESLPAVKKALAAAFASENEKGRVQLLTEMAVLRVMQGRDDDAVSLYEQALAKAPESVVVLNNYAVLLSEMPGRADEALRYIDRALAAVPGSFEVLDSRALVLIGLGRHDEARETLERLCRANKKNARYRLHLAIAQKHLLETEKSRANIEQAVKDGLNEELLTPSERRELQKIAGDLSAARN